MKTESLSIQTIEMLISKKIIDANDNWIKLDNGIVIYLSDEEIQSLNN